MEHTKLQALKFKLCLIYDSDKIHILDFGIAGWFLYINNNRINTEGYTIEKMCVYLQGIIDSHLIN